MAASRTEHVVFGAVATMPDTTSVIEKQIPAAILVKWQKLERRRKARSCALKVFGGVVGMLYATHLYLVLFEWERYGFMQHPLRGALLMLGLPSLVGLCIIITQCVSRSQRRTLHRMTRFSHAQTVPILLDALKLPTNDMMPKVFLALIPSLAQLKHSDAHLLNDAQRIMLYQTLATRTFALPLPSPQSAEYRLAALRAVEQIGDSKAIEFLEPIAADEWENVQVRQLAQEVLQSVRHRIDDVRQSQTLLRPSHETTDNSTLLKPAIPIAPEPDNLLRPVISRHV
jgi:hypothetical protein